MTLVAYRDHKNTGILYQVIPGARSLWIDMMKLSPVAMDEKPGDEDRDDRRDHVSFRVSGG